MTRPILADRVKETTQTTGTGTLSLAGNATGFQSFVGAGLDGKSTYYAIVDDPTSTTEWEVGVGTVTAGTPNTLTRDRVVASSNSGSKVSWSAGTKTVIVTSVSETFNAIMDTVDSDLVTAGSSTAYTLTTNRPAVGLYEGRFVCFKLDETCGADPTLNVDSEGAVNLVDLNGTNIASGALVAGAYYWCKYNASTAKWVVFSPFGYLSTAGGTIASLTVSGAFVGAGSAAFSGVITPAQITANTANYEPTGLSGAVTLRLSSDADRVITSLAGGATGRILVLENVGSFNIELRHEDSGTATNRFDFPGDQDIVLTPGDTITLKYDGTLTRWICLSTTASKTKISGGFRALKIVAADAGTSATVTATAVTLEDTSGRAIRVNTLSETLSLATTGANALDTGTVATSTWYYVWAIAMSDGTADVLASTSATAPTMPSGYTYKALIGAVRTKSGSAVLVGTIQYGRRVQYTTAPLPQLSSGALGTFGSTWATVDVTALAPTAIASAIHVVGWMTANNSALLFAPNNTYDATMASTTGTPAIAGGGAQHGAVNFTFPPIEQTFLLESSNIYMVASASTKSVCAGFEINL